jgi:hypothetical protein
VAQAAGDVTLGAAGRGRLNLVLQGRWPPGPADPGPSPDRGLRVMMAHCGFFADPS